MKEKISQFLNHLLTLIPGIVTVAIYMAVVIIFADIKLSMLLLIGGLLMGLILGAMNVNFLPLRPLIITYTIISVLAFFFLAYESKRMSFSVEDLIVVSFFVITILIMLLIAMTKQDNPSNYIIKIIVDWYGVILLFVFLFSLYYFICHALVNDSGVAQNDLQTCAYFSCITFTGLGYGEIVTRPEFRMVAALESIVGYICMGGVAATIYSLIQAKLQEQRKAKRLEEMEKND